MGPGSDRLSALVLGAITRDLDVGDGSGAGRPGGVVYYAGLAFARLGAQTRIVTRVRPDDVPYLLARLHAEGIETLPLPSLETTTYLNDYSGDRDVHELCAASDPIHVDDLPASWRRADVIQLGPLHRGDLDPAVPAALRGFKGIDLQGLLREATPAGTRLAPFEGLDPFLGSVDVVQVSADELRPALAGESIDAFVRRHSISEMIVTRGARGATLIERGRATSIPARRTQRLHPVGAGDVFLAAYLFLRANGQPPVAALRGATEVCAEKLERGEVPKNFNPREDA